MVENLRVRLDHESRIQDLARAMETPFEIDAHDIGVVGSIAYSQKMRKFYEETYDSTRREYRTALEPSSVPEALALRLTQYSLPKSEQEARRILGDVAETITNPELAQEESSKQQHRIYWKKNPSPTDIVIANAGIESLDKLFKKIREFQYSADLKLYKPTWIHDSEWTRGYFAGCILPTIHHLKTTWMQMQGRFEGIIRRS